MGKRFLTFVILLGIRILYAENLPHNIVVAKDGTGNFASVSEAIESLPMYCYERVTIFIKNGTYNEKIKIDRDYVTLIGEDRDSTRIEFNQLREDWNKNRDDIGPAVVNIFADNIIIKNLTIENTQPQIGPHAFAIYGTGTRTILQNCKVLSKGGDTVSLWDYKTGMYYHDSCYFQGAVDFVCPRGWCFISNSTFYEVKNTAAVWHAAPTNSNQKFVLENCDFQGADSFYLARHHYDAQFYFLNCTFPALMRNKPVEHVMNMKEPEKNRPYLYGDRYYFHHCSRAVSNYSWFADNENSWPNHTTPDSITPVWTFDYQWNPTDTTELKIARMEYENGSLYLWFNELVMAVDEPEIVSAFGVHFKYFSGSGRDRLEFKSNQEFDRNDLTKTFKLVKGNIQNITATVNPRKANRLIIQ